MKLSKPEEIFKDRDVSWTSNRTSTEPVKNTSQLKVGTLLVETFWKTSGKTD
jgi:hypothetical protein